MNIYGKLTYMYLQSFLDSTQIFTLKVYQNLVINIMNN